MNQNREELLFQLALTKPAAARASWLERECANDAALRARLEALLAAHEQAEPVLDAPAAGVKATLKLELADEEPEEVVGQKIGRYKILEKVGEGGCGVVYVAEQTEPVRRRIDEKENEPVTYDSLCDRKFRTAVNIVSYAMASDFGVSVSVSVSISQALTLL